MNKNILDFIGNTPLVKLQKIVPEGSADVYVKLEEFNPGGSIKTRVAYSMVSEAEKSGLLKPHSGQTIIEPTGGNTGMGLAIVSAIRGYHAVFVVPDNFSQEKIKLLRIYGAEVILSDSTTGNDSHIRKAKEVVSANPHYIMLDQFSNLANPKAHYLGTGLEITGAVQNIDCFVAGIGSGGTLSGIGKEIKEKSPKTLIVGVQPKGCDTLKGKAVPHKILALALGVLPKVLNVELIDKMISVDFDDVMPCLKNLATQEGLLLGISSGANILAAIEMAKEMGEGKTVVTVAPDSGRSYINAFTDGG
jgi:cysteine synthase A